MNFDEYVKCLNWDPSVRRKHFNENKDSDVIQNKKHEIYLQKSNKH